MTSNARSLFKGARYEIAITRLSETILVTVTLNILDTCSISGWGTARMQLSLVSAVSVVPGKIHRDHHLNPRARCPLGIAKSIRRPMAAEKFRIAACSTAGCWSWPEPLREVTRAWPCERLPHCYWQDLIQGGRTRRRSPLRADWFCDVGGITHGSTITRPMA